jgi:hypothetical protein
MKHCSNDRDDISVRKNYFISKKHTNEVSSRTENGTYRVVVLDMREDEDREE